MVALFSAVTIVRHDAKAMWLLLGVTLNVGLSVTLKRILNQARPSTYKPDPGMPSSHAQSIFFIVFTVIRSGNYLLSLPNINYIGSANII